jgi:hypothetical protein
MRYGTLVPLGQTENDLIDRKTEVRGKQIRAGAPPPDNHGRSSSVAAAGRRTITDAETAPLPPAKLPHKQ